MAYHFSCNQFENRYRPQRLCNWETPKWYPPQPRANKGTTKFICNNNGHLLPGVKRVDKNPFGCYLGTYQLPRRITQKFVAEYNQCLVNRIKWQRFPECHSKLLVEPKSVDVQTKCESVQPLIAMNRQLKQLAFCKKKTNTKHPRCVCQNQQKESKQFSKTASTQTVKTQFKKT